MADFAFRRYAAAYRNIKIIFYGRSGKVPGKVGNGVDEVFSCKVLVDIDGSRHIPLKKIFVKISKFVGALCAGDIENNFYVSIGCRVSSKSKILRLAFR